MKQNLNFGKVSMSVLILVIWVWMGSCCKEEIVITPYFRCEVNGIPYKTYNPVITFPNGTRYPHTYYLQTQGNRCFNFFTFFKAKKASEDFPEYTLNFYFYSDVPLVPGKTYHFSPQPGKEHAVSYSELSFFQENSISHVLLSSSAFEHFSMGSGYMYLDETGEDGEWIYGTVAFEFVSPLEKEGEREQIEVRGEFRSILRAETYIPVTE